MTIYATTDQYIIRTNTRTVPSVAQLAYLEELLDAASRAIDHSCRRDDNAFSAAAGATASYMTAFGEAWLRIPPCAGITEVAVKASLSATTYTVWDTPTTPMAGDGDWIPCRGSVEDPKFGVEPYNLLIIELNGEYGIFLDGGGTPVVKITAEWAAGTEVPAEIREFTIMQTAMWAKAYEGAQADQLGSDEFGQIKIRRTLSKSVRDGLDDGGWILPLYGGA